MSARGVLLLQPWIEDFYHTDCRIQPIGLAYLAGALKQALPDLPVQIYDCLAGGELRGLPWPREFAYLKNYYGERAGPPFGLFRQYYRAGKSEAQIQADLAAMPAPLYVGISSLFTPYYRESLRLAALCRELFPDAPIVMGGNHASLFPESLLYSATEARSLGLAAADTIPPWPERPAGARADYVVCGEGETGLVEFTRRLLAGAPLEETPNLVSRASLAAGAPRPEPIAPDMATLARPDFSGLNPDDYQYDGERMSFLITSRSCPHRCSFCSIHAVFGKEYRIRTPDDVFEEILERYAAGVRHFDIEDDNFTVNKRSVEALLDRIIAAGLKARFSAMNGLSYISLDEPLLEKMRAAGFERLNLALVSADPLTLEFTERPHTVEKFHWIMQIADRLDFRTTAYFIAGMPGQSLAVMADTLRVLAGERCLVGASPFYFTPGSPIHRRMANDSRLRLASFGRDHFFAARLTALDLETDEFSRDDVYTLFRLTRWVNYVKEGLDRGLPAHADYFAPAAECLASKAWPAGRRGERAPFSRAAGETFESGGLVVRGYRSRRAIVWQPGAGFSDAPAVATSERPASPRHTPAESLRR